MTLLNEPGTDLLSRSFIRGKLTKQAPSFLSFEIDSAWRPVTPEPEQQTPEISDTQESYLTTPNFPNQSNTFSMHY